MLPLFRERLQPVDARAGIRVNPQPTRMTALWAMRAVGLRWRKGRKGSTRALARRSALDECQECQEMALLSRSNRGKLRKKT
jgi:hypothetical protein